MRISLNWLRQFTDINMPIDELVEKIGAQLGAVEEVVDYGKKYQGIIIAKVVSCEKHPNADKLSVCMIDDGGKAEGVTRNEQGLVQVVCGAPNVRTGLTVAWLPPGATVPSTYDKDPFVLEARELRGTTSNGMIASAAELAISDDHSGIVELDIEAAAGSDFAETYDLNDYIIDIENKMFTHRPDCFGILGVAREIAGIQNIKFESPEWYLKPLDRIKPGKAHLPLEVRNEVPELAPRFMAIAMANVTVKPSPLLIQTYLSRVGLRPINNIVDVTNYLMVLTGQPLHAYDYDKVAAQDGDEKATIVVRKPHKGETITLLNGKTIEPREDAVMIATASKVIGIGGVMGGADTEVDTATRNIIIECANFDMYSIRKTSMAHGLFTDAVTRFNKGQSPHQNERILEEAVATVQYVSGGHVASDVIDIHGTISVIEPVHVSAKFINERLGLHVDPAEMAARLHTVEFAVQHIMGDSLTVTPPFWRTDIHIPEDVVEEVGRLIGFDRLPVELPKASIKPTKRDGLLDFKAKLRDTLSRFGANEVLTYSFVHGDLLDKVGQDKSLAYKLSNALSPELQYYRLSIIPSLLEKIHPNIKAGYDTFALFEIGKVHDKHTMDELDVGLPKEQQTLALACAANDAYVSKQSGAALYGARKYLDALATKLGINLQYHSQDELPEDQRSKPFDAKRTAVVKNAVDGRVLGVLGEFNAATRRSLKLPVHSAGFEINIENLFHAATATPYQPISKYPAVQQDISLKVNKSIPYQQIVDELSKCLTAKSSSVLSAKMSPIDIYEAEAAKHVTFRINAVHYEKTMTAAEVHSLLDELASELKNAIGAERI
jgi:phenylalanyl-tRNA synthetase beta chain